MKHTEGKLQISRPDCQPPILAPTTNPARPIVQACACWGADSANLERLRDCWNGCEQAGIKNPLAVGGLLEACKAMVEAYGCECLDEGPKHHCPMCQAKQAIAEATEGV